MSDRIHRCGERVPGTIYDVVRFLGEGGMGVVYEVEDTTIGKRYVLKTLRAGAEGHAELAVRMQKEARALARLSHPNIVEVVTAGVIPVGAGVEAPYFVMERLLGHGLREVLASRGRLPLDTAVGIAVDLLDALDHAHSVGIVHRDVKPENVFLHTGPTGKVVTKLLDFGIARFEADTDRRTGRRFVGTYRYASPEQITGQPITPRSDVYSTALVLAEMVTGRPPSEDPRALPMRDQVPGLPPELAAIVVPMLAWREAERPTDALAAADSLRALLRALRGHAPAAAGEHVTLESLVTDMGPPVVGAGDGTAFASTSPVVEGAAQHTVRLAPPVPLASDRQGRVAASAASSPTPTPVVAEPAPQGPRVRRAAAWSLVGAVLLGSLVLVAGAVARRRGPPQVEAAARGAVDRAAARAPSSPPAAAAPPEASVGAPEGTARPAVPSARPVAKGTAPPPPPPVRAIPQVHEPLLRPSSGLGE